MKTQLAIHLLDILFPPRCAACEARLVSGAGNKICAHCLSKLTYLRLPVCRICGVELYSGVGGSHLCGDCLKRPPPFSLARSVAWYEEVVRELVLRLKFTTDTTVIPGLSQLISGYDTTDFSQADWIVPVPLHPQRLRKRGLNQALLLARLFFPEHRERLRTDLLRRTKNSLPQARLSGSARRKNLRGGFGTTGKGEIAGAVICLVDDVYTTGATAVECSRTMLKGGAREVRVLTLARAKVGRRG